ncbi:hypothetical protein BDB00DRAFT_788245 [Zychaea mexicana]|uniref:uncharacterized protein n=1 Tax=Zychaea mexicana TaxID=64656 RepID=UPI0022FE8084|nr:uncharacterized protein BDB00DRAFT_788245 [Zychaea mexicana]KAI9493012.1 hypothetical protein BDB00DRAFT_788245 [Zychaea mexicana]
MYPKAAGFVAWWNRKEVRGTVFPAVSTLHEGLRDYYGHTTYAVESFHNSLYHLIKKRQSIVDNFRCVLKYVDNDEKAIGHFLRGVTSYYGLNMSRGREKVSTKKRVRSKRKTVDRYENDGRAPDTAQMLKKANRKNWKCTAEVSDCGTGGDNSSSSEDGDKWPIYDKIAPRDIQDSD